MSFVKDILIVLNMEVRFSYSYSYPHSQLGETQDNFT